MTRTKGERLALHVENLDDDGIDTAGTGGPPSGTAGGQLEGSYPDPDVATIHADGAHADFQAAAESTAASALSGLVSFLGTAAAADTGDFDAAGSAAAVAGATLTRAKIGARATYGV